VIENTDTPSIDEQTPKSITCDKYLNAMVNRRAARYMPSDHERYLRQLSAEIQPPVIFDIGASVLHWTDTASKYWPNASYFLFEATASVEPLYRMTNYKYFVGPLSDQDQKLVSFYEQEPNQFGQIDLSGNSYYKENTEHYANIPPKELVSWTLDTIVKYYQWPLPDLIKMDTQGSELDILYGAPICLAHATDVILEAQHTNYNEGAPKVEAVIKFMEDQGFTLVSNFTRSNIDGDYHFRRILTRGV